MNETKPNFFATKAGYYTMVVISYIIIISIFYATMEAESEIMYIPFAITAIFGWRALNRVQPAMFLWMSWTGWLTYFIVKLILACTVGMVIAPYYIGKKISLAISNAVRA